jgi:hypothetical protein
MSKHHHKITSPVATPELLYSTGSPIGNQSSDTITSPAAIPELLYSTGSPMGKQRNDHHTDSDHRDIDGGQPTTYIPTVTNTQTTLLDRVIARVSKNPLDVFTESPTATVPLRLRDRIVAAVLAALCFYSAIILFSISYHLDTTNHITLFGCVTSACAALYWIVISGLVFSFYTRNADFMHIFRLSIQFQIFILMIGSLGNVAASKLFSMLP